MTQTPLLPVATQQATESYHGGQFIDRVVIQRLDGQYRVILYPVGGREPVVLAKRRGGVRTWTQIQYCVAYIEKKFPRVKQLEIDLQ